MRGKIRYLFKKQECRRSIHHHWIKIYEGCKQRFTGFSTSGMYPDYRKAIWLSYAEGDKNRTGALWETGKNVRTKGLIMQSFCFWYRGFYIIELLFYENESQHRWKEVCLNDNLVVYREKFKGFFRQMSGSYYTRGNQMYLHISFLFFCQFQQLPYQLLSSPTVYLPLALTTRSDAIVVELYLMMAPTSRQRYPIALHPAAPRIQLLAPLTTE